MSNVAYLEWTFLGRVYAKDKKEALKKGKQWWGGVHVIDGVRLSRNAQYPFAPDKEFDAFGHLRSRKAVKRGYRGPR